MSTNLIGLMMIRDEQDMLAEALRNHSCFCRAIFVLDGSRGEAQVATREICERFPKVVGYWHDDDTGYQQPLRDGARQFLLERAREMYGLNNWYALLHGDELWGEDPRQKLEVPDQSCAVTTQLYHFFPHSTERDSWSFPANGSIEATARWYMMPPGKEHRLFFDTGEHNYEVSLHSRTIPSTLQHQFVLPIAIKQYNYRTPEQACHRAQERKDSGWQENHYQHLLNGPEGFFVDTLAQFGKKWLGWIPAGQGQVTNTGANPLPTLTCGPNRRMITSDSRKDIGCEDIGSSVSFSSESAPMLESIWWGRLYNYRDTGYPHVQGWMRKELFGALEVIQLAHDQMSVCGSLVEIGVYHGAFFLALDQLRRADETAAAFDVFAAQELNVDCSGNGDLDAFEKNLGQYSGAAESVAIVQADSMTLSAEKILAALKGQRPRFFSIDGGHTTAHVFADLSLAEQTLCPGGVVFVDDYMHPAWPEVTEGLHNWMQSHVKLQPFAWVGRKLLLTTVAHRERMFGLYKERMTLIPAAKYKEVRLFGCPVLSAIPDWFIG